jgi:hypothetical protein
MKEKKKKEKERKKKKEKIIPCECWENEKGECNIPDTEAWCTCSAAADGPAHNRQASQ